MENESVLENITILFVVSIVVTGIRVGLRSGLRLGFTIMTAIQWTSVAMTAPTTTVATFKCRRVVEWTRRRY